jgi:hypothetical protein
MADNESRMSDFDEGKGDADSLISSPLTASHIQESQEQHESRSVHSTQSTGNKSSSSTGSLAKRRQETKEKEKLKHTILKFIFLTEESKEVVLKYRPASYSELQREIARLTPRYKTMFVVQNIAGEKVFPPNFKPSEQFIIRELLTPLSSKVPKMTPKWEFEDYHDAVFRSQIEESSYMNDVWGRK